MVLESGADEERTPSGLRGMLCTLLCAGYVCVCAICEHFMEPYTYYLCLSPQVKGKKKYICNLFIPY